MVAKTDYNAELDKLFQNVSKPIGFEVVLQHFSNIGVSEQTIRNYLKKYLTTNKHLIGKVIGIYPATAAVIDLAETKLGAVNGSNVVAINIECKRIIDSITLPKHEEFLSKFLDEFENPKTHQLEIKKTKLVDYLYNEYVDFVHEADNGLVSIAGTINEQILTKGLENVGLVADSDYRKTGRNSEGDVQIEHHGRTTKIMFCEIKSYAARERLLRGLQDIQQPMKIGVGFFKDAGEFNPARTQTLLGAAPLAIYMPETTFQNLHPDSRSQITSKQDRLYRPINNFFDDMLAFHKNGELPRFV